MCLEIFKITIVIITYYVVLLSCSSPEDYNRKDKLVLNSLELIDLIRNEQDNKDDVTSGHYNYNSKERTSDLIVNENSGATTVDASIDEDQLKSRKVWSRWGKWGECSVTCGAGSIRRARVCVAGRCAPGEREEQRRPCARAPCAQRPDDSPDELHYLEN